MNSAQFIIVLGVIIAILVLLIAKLSSYFKIFAADTKYICDKIDHAKSNKVYQHWREELYCHYLMLIPFIKKENALKISKYFISRNNHPKKEEHKDSLVPMLLPSILSISICLICICGMTWAWYSASIDIDKNTIKAAYYDISVEVKDEQDILVEKSNDGNYILPTGTYSVTLTAKGNASTGYCKMKIADIEKELYTEQMYPTPANEQKQSITFIIKVEDSSKNISFLPVWGTYKGTSEITDGDGVVYKITQEVEIIPIEELSVSPSPEPTEQPTEPEPEPNPENTEQPDNYTEPVEPEENTDTPNPLEEEQE